MARKPLLIALGVVALALLALGIFWLRRPAPTPPAVTAGGSGTAAPAVFSTTTQDNGFGEQVAVVLADDKGQLARFYQRPYIKEFYGAQDGELVTENQAGAEITHHAALPPFDYQQSLAGKSYLDLLLLRNELYARNGYCFMNSTVRNYFDKQKWYQPVWQEDSVDATYHSLREAGPLPVYLNKQEAAFAQKIHAQELVLLAHRVAPQGGFPMLGLDYVVNQREETLTPTMRPVLARHNFVIVPTREEQLFYLYDQNEYTFTPNFITTDLVLQLLHKYLNGILSDVEEEHLAPVVAQMLGQGATQAQALGRQSQTPQAREAADWAAAYYAIGRNLLTGSTAPVAGTYASQVATEVALGTAAQGKGSLFLQDSLFEYQALKPRGMYTRNDTTRRYFRTVKWLNTAPVFLDTDAGLLHAVALAKALAASPPAAVGFATLTHVLDVLVGDEDNRSLTNLLQILQRDYAGQSLDQLAAPATLARLRQQLVAAGTDRIQAKGATDKAAEALGRPTLLFTAGRYTFDGEILSRLTEVLKPKPKRPFPKGLDAFAAFGNRPAQDILLNQYHEAATWPAYPDTLRALQRQFAGRTNFDQNLYTKTMQVLLGLNAPGPDANPPYFARTSAWQRRNLSTALAGWAELKHDLLLYTEQPMAAEMGGGGGGPPAPHHLGYIEPNLPFWERSLALLAFQNAALHRLHANTPHLDSLNQHISQLVRSLQALAKKEVAHQPLTAAEMDNLSGIGGEVEALTLETLKLTSTDPLPDRERHLGTVADVYANNGTVLEEAVGAADILYVVVEINNTPVLARGAMLSYYEFTSPSRLTDEEWKAQLLRAAPPRPAWLRDLLVTVPALNKSNGNTSVGGQTQYD
ncbi:DUF3160 domain-containing protein [Hymenobacter sp. RP-2-7]|uniref:DUF3160 domain-containing protein n=1 Tax=Hymenobacter polaris TaxID=2682546 RepID=A0A7Y0AIL6_9BACT|nr:DUF3160 domain-containing protein [Hymenobacter polaris]NML68017.1 DUF3160 domain-containing protein [Hymenobacter polaris]